MMAQLYFNDMLVLFRSKLFIGVALLSVLLAAYNPMALTSSAEAITESYVKTIKDKVVKELDQRISSLNKDLTKLKSKSMVTTTETTTIGQDSLTSTVALGTDVVSKAVASTESMIKQLTDLKTKATDATTVEQIQKLALAVDGQFLIDTVTGTYNKVMVAISSATAAFGKIKSTQASLKAKVDACTTSVESGTASADCPGASTSSVSKVSSAKSQMDGLTSIMSTIGSILMTVLPMILSLATSLIGMASSFGGIANLGSTSDLSSIGGGLSNVTQSLTSIVSQLGLSNGLSGNAQSVLGTVTSLIGSLGI